MSKRQTITIRRPDDWHLHLRDGAMLEAVAGYTARRFARAIVMPNLAPPVTTVAAAKRYRQHILNAVGDVAFTPLMTCYLTDEADPQEIRRGFNEGIFTAAKLYPAGATTNSAMGVTDMARISGGSGSDAGNRHAAFGARRGHRPGNRYFRPRDGVYRAGAGPDAG